LASIRKENDEYLLGEGAKAAVRRADNLATFMCRLYRNSGRLNFLEP
jgi:hypothetical protein